MATLKLEFMTKVHNYEEKIKTEVQLDEFDEDQRLANTVGLHICKLMDRMGFSLDEITDGLDMGINFLNAGKYGRDVTPGTDDEDLASPEGSTLPSNVMSFEEFEKEIKAKPSFRNYMYKLYTEDMTTE